MTVSYEIGLKSQINKDLALSATAFYNDKFDYIVSRRIEVRDATGRFVAENLLYQPGLRTHPRGWNWRLRRLGNSLRATLSGAYQIATGKSNTAAESALQIRQAGLCKHHQRAISRLGPPLRCETFSSPTPPTPRSILADFRWKASAYRSAPPSNRGYATRPTSWCAPTKTAVARIRTIEDQPFAAVGAPWFWANLRISRDFFMGRRGRRVTFSFELENITNYQSAAIVNPVTGRGYQLGDPVPLSWRDPNYPDPQDRGLPPTNPARFLQPRQMWFGIEVGL
ncbi:MAG: hypothetical protein R3B47_16640 [Bacteroidia bacterium]